MMTMTIRSARPEECLNVDLDAEDLPIGVECFDSTDWSYSVFCNIGKGDWVVEIVVDGVNPMRCPAGRLFHLQMLNDGGFVRKVS